MPSKLAKLRLRVAQRVHARALGSGNKSFIRAAAERLRWALVRYVQEVVPGRKYYLVASDLGIGDSIWDVIRRGGELRARACVRGARLRVRRATRTFARRCAPHTLVGV